VLGVLGMLIGWIPFVGLLAVPVAFIGLLMAGLGIVLALLKGFTGLGMPILGGGVSLLAVMISFASTGVMSAAIQNATDQNRSEGQHHAVSTSFDKSQYIAQHLQLYDVSAKYVKSVVGNKVPGVFFKIRNSGTRTLNRVVITAYFKDREGKTIQGNRILT